jgi:hypothetical protein
MSACSLLPTQMAGGQSFSTITSLATTTQQITVPIFSQSPVSTTTVTRTGTTTLFMTSLSLRGLQPRYCYFQSFSYNVTAGERLVGTWKSDMVINFYLYSASDYKLLTYSQCGLEPAGYLAIMSRSSYSLDWVAPKSETLYFVFHNYAEGSDIQSPRTVSFTLYKLGTASSSSTMYTTVSIPSINTNTVTLTSIYYSTQSLFFPSVTIGGNYDIGWLLVLAIVGIAAFMLVYYGWPMIRSRTSTARRKTSARAFESEVIEPRQVRSVAQRADEAPEDLFCFKCGARLKPHAEFCSKCGSSQA